MSNPAIPHPDGGVTIRGTMAELRENLAALDPFTLKQVTDALYAVSDSCGYAFVPGADNDDLGVILFCGFLERFRTISLLRDVSAGCLVVQDPLAPWFTGSSLCGDVEQVLEAAQATLPRARRWLLLGQSSGGYAALLASRFVSPSLTLAFAPQTFDDSQIKASAIHWPRNFRYSQTMSVGGAIRDLRTMFFRERDPGASTTCCIVSSFSEHKNPPTEWLWLDAMHWGRLVDHSDVNVFITPSASHPVLLDAVETYAQLVADLCGLDFADRTSILQAVNRRVYGG